MTMKKETKKTVAIVTGILLVAVFLGVAGILGLLFLRQNSLKEPDEETIKIIAAEALERRFDEEFTVYKVYKIKSQSCFAVCSPKRNSEVVFEAEISGYQHSNVQDNNYERSAVSWKISQRLEEELQEYFPGCYIHTIIQGFSFGKPDNDPLYNTVEEYMEMYENSSYKLDYVECLIQIHVNEKNLSQGMSQEAYRYFAEELQKDITEKKFPSAIIWVYGMDEEKLEWCRNYFRENCQGGSDYYDMLEGCSRFRMGYPGREFNMTYEEFLKAGEGDR